MPYTASWKSVETVVSKTSNIEKTMHMNINPPFLCNLHGFDRILKFCHTPDRSGMYLQCHAVYTVGTLQPLQCTCSIGCSYTADTLHTAVYTVPTLHVHCSYSSIFVHCTYTASKWQCTCSIRAAYTAATLKLYCLYTPLRSGMQLWMAPLDYLSRTTSIMQI